ncbi:hypothetical protein M0R45_037261 [Rubus argutus]
MTKLILKRTMSDTVRGSVSEEGTAREYLENIAEKFTESAKGETSVLLDSFIAMKYNGTNGVREHIMKMIDITTKLKDLKIAVDAQFLVHMALNSLPASFSQLKTTYNAQKDKWTLNELISICVQEEERMKKEEVVVNLVNKPQPKHHKPKGKKNGSSSSAAAKNPTLAPKPNNLKAKNNTSFKCFFCKREGHMKRECTKYKDWVKKRGFSKEEGSKKEYCHVYLIKEKSQSLEKFIIFRTEVEKQLGKEIKVVRSDRGGEYYGKFDESGQNKGPFALYLQEHGIAAQYTTPGTPEQNGVAERRNRTFLNMVRSMMCASGLPTFLWGEALLTANYLTNRTTSKSVSSTPFELWCGRKPSFYHLHVWGCKAEAKPYNPQLGKLDSKTVSAFFIGYPERSKGFKFYCPSYTSRIIETNKAVFYDELSAPESTENVELELETI